MDGELYLRVRDSQDVSNGEPLRVIKRLGWMGVGVEPLSAGQFGRYLVVGAVNTAFGQRDVAGLRALMTPHILFAYIVASIMA